MQQYNISLNCFEGKSLNIEFLTEIRKKNSCGKKLKSLTTLYASLVCSGKSLHIFAIIGARKFHSVK